MIKDKELERLINFSDAIVAVAITLLIVPVTNQFQTLNEENFFNIIKSDNFVSTLAGFFISFFVIYSLWAEHRNIFSEINVVSPTVIILNRLWLLTIVILPAVISLNLGIYSNINELVFAIVLTLSSLFLQLIAKVLYSHRIFNNIILMLLIFILILILILPNVSRAIFLLLLLAIPLKKLFPTVFKV